MESSQPGNGKQGFSGDGGLATAASLNFPASVFQYKHEIYIADKYNHRIRKIDRNGVISTIAGTGLKGYNGDDILATDADFDEPGSLFVHNDQVYFIEQHNSRIRKILPNGIIKTVAGTGKIGRNGEDLTTTVSRRLTEGDMLATQCKLPLPRGICIDSDSQVLYFADILNNSVSKIDLNGMMRRVVGTGTCGYSGDVPFDFHQYPHIGPRRKKPIIKPFPHALYDLTVICETIKNSSQRL